MSVDELTQRMTDYTQILSRHDAKDENNVNASNTSESGNPRNVATYGMSAANFYSSVARCRFFKIASGKVFEPILILACIADKSSSQNYKNMYMIVMDKITGPNGTKNRESPIHINLNPTL
jgi:hypothetical protein